MVITMVIAMVIAMLINQKPRVLILQADRGSLEDANFDGSPELQRFGAGGP